MKLRQLGTNCQLLQFGKPDVALFKYLTALRLHLLQTNKCDSIVQSYNSLAIYNGEPIDLNVIQHIKVEDIPDKVHNLKLSIHPDIEEFAKIKKMDVKSIIDNYTSVEYTIAAIGFKPNFPYLWGLPKVLHCERLEKPRARIPAGSVGIGGQQTGIYPCSSPSGWHIIGTVTTIFTDFEVGHKIRFNT